jgi:hypothetical protein
MGVGEVNQAGSRQQATSKEAKRHFQALFRVSVRFRRQPHSQTQTPPDSEEARSVLEASRKLAPIKENKAI